MMMSKINFHSSPKSQMMCPMMTICKINFENINFFSVMTREDWALCMMDHHHHRISEDPEQKSVVGRMDISCRICDTPNEASDGRRAVFRVFIIS